MRPLRFIVLMSALFGLCVESAGGGARLHCTTREDPAFQRLLTECTDGSRAVSKWDPQFKRWQTDIVRAPKPDRASRGWPASAKNAR